MATGFRPPNPKKPKLTVEEAVTKLVGMMHTEHYQKYVADIVLNLDPKTMKGQELKGVFDLPHGTGLEKKVAVLTQHEGLMTGAMEAGAVLVDSDHKVINKQLIRKKIRCGFKNQRLNFDHVIATVDFEQEVTKGTGLAVRLKRHKITPCKEHRTLVRAREVPEAVQKYHSGKFQSYCNNKHGHLAGVTLGHVDTHEPWQVAQNLEYVLKRVFAIMPRDFGKSKNAKPHLKGKYLIKIFFGIGSVGTCELDLNKVVPRTDELGRPIDRKVVFGIDDYTRKL